MFLVLRPSEKPYVKAIPRDESTPRGMASGKMERLACTWVMTEWQGYEEAFVERRQRFQYFQQLIDSHHRRIVFDDDLSFLRPFTHGHVRDAIFAGERRF